MAALNNRVFELIEAHPGLFKTITVDNGPLRFKLEVKRR